MCASAQGQRAKVNRKKSGQMRRSKSKVQASGFRLALALALMTTAGAWSSLGDVRAQPMQILPPWQRTDSQHFEIHYLPALAPELDRVVRSAERAYERICSQLNFALPTRVPLVMFTPSGPMTAEEIRAAATESPHQVRTGAASCSHSLKDMGSPTR